MKYKIVERSTHDTDYEVLLLETNSKAVMDFRLYEQRRTFIQNNRFGELDYTSADDSWEDLMCEVKGGTTEYLYPVLEMENVNE